MGLGFTLRDYQEKLKNEASQILVKEKAVICQAPGGTGKTKTFLAIAYGSNQKNRTCLIITDRTQVYKQISEESGGVTIGDGVKNVYIENGKTYVAMAQTLRNRPKIIEQFNNLPKEVVVIIDECHISTTCKILDKLTNRMLLGFTATPDYRIAKHLPKYYNDIVTTEQISWFIDRKHLCDYQHIMKKSGEGVEKIKKQNGDFSSSEQTRFFGKEEHYQELFEDLKKHPFNKCMLFTSSIEHCEAVYNRLCDAGYNCSIFHSKRKDNALQKDMFEDKQGNNIMVSVGTLTTGYDYPPVDMVILYRATTSLALYLQMIFRADRPKEGMFFIVLDYGLNGKRHGLYSQDRNWQELWKEPKKRRESDGVSAQKFCPDCESILPSSAKNCKFCGALLPVQEKDLSDVGKSVDLTNKLKPIKGKLISSLTAKEFALYANVTGKKMYCVRVIRNLDRINGTNLLEEYAAEMNYKKGWIDRVLFQMSGNESFYDIVI